MLIYFLLVFFCIVIVSHPSARCLNMSSWVTLTLPLCLARSNEIGSQLLAFSLLCFDNGAYGQVKLIMLVNDDIKSKWIILTAIIHVQSYYVDHDSWVHVILKKEKKKHFFYQTKLINFFYIWNGFTFDVIKSMQVGKMKYL